ncbi:MAG: hypothetical protein M0T70_02920 [Geobacteraceae bacterium]|nr:hypothetical protein [Geobacteraceae bacterium]
MIKIVLTFKPYPKVQLQSAPLAVVALAPQSHVTLKMSRAELVKLSLDTRSLAVIKVPAFPHDPRELKDASGDWFMGADGQAVWGAN